MKLRAPSHRSEIQYLDGCSQFWENYPFISTRHFPRKSAYPKWPTLFPNSKIIVSHSSSNQDPGQHIPPLHATNRAPLAQVPKGRFALVPELPCLVFHCLCLSESLNHSRYAVLVHYICTDYTTLHCTLQCPEISLYWFDLIFGSPLVALSFGKRDMAVVDGNRQALAWWWLDEKDMAGTEWPNRDTWTQARIVQEEGK